MLILNRSLFIFFLFATTLNAQFTDDFSDGNLTMNPAWEGDLSHFTINDESQLQLNAPETGSSSLRVPTAISDSSVWELYFKLDFNPSNSNRLYIVLQSDNQQLLSGSGYYFLLGETGNEDAIHFYRMDAGNGTMLTSATVGAIADSPEVRMRIERDANGTWTLFADYNGGQNPEIEFTFSDGTYGGGAGLFFGIQCEYTSTRTDKFFFDDILVAPLLPDTSAPTLLAVEAVSATELDVFFDEPLGEDSAIEPSNYLVDNGIGQPAAAFLDDSNKTMVHLALQTPMISPNDYLLTVNNIGDEKGNVGSSQSKSFTYLKFDEPAAFDILINEIMADPTPPVTMPPVEFIELYNRSDKVIDLAGFGFSAGGTPQPFPPFIFYPNSYLLICDVENETVLNAYGEVVGLSDFPSLVNSGDELALTDPNGNLIHSVQYTLDAYQDAQKSEGGWTLELINPLAPCTGESNWRASNSLLGGTPGQPNSVLEETPDQQGPKLMRAFCDRNEPSIIKLFFDEKLNPSVVEALPDFSIFPSIDISNAHLILPQANELHLFTASPLIPNIIYELPIPSSVTDCIGNTFAERKATLALPGEIAPKDIIINEVLFNPNIGGSDFVELYNRSDKILNIGDLVIGNVHAGNDTVVREVTVNHLLYPGEYVVLTEDVHSIQANYNVLNEQALFHNELPAFNNEEGNVTIYRGEGNDVLIIDAFDYKEDFHHPLLDDVNGISLERLNPDGPSQDANNWHSAAKFAGYATPTYQNSQQSTVSLPDGFF